MKKNNQIKKSINQKVFYLSTLAVSTFSLLYFLNNVEKDYDTKIKNFTHKEFEKKVYELIIEEDIKKYVSKLNDSIVLNNLHLMSNDFQKNLDSIIDYHISDLDPLLKNKISEEMKNNAERWINEKQKSIYFSDKNEFK
jgi:uncharacterized membrane protein YheB (UPF0754 family)